MGCGCSSMGKWWKATKRQQYGVVNELEIVVT